MGSGGWMDGHFDAASTPEKVMRRASQQVGAGGGAVHVSHGPRSTCHIVYRVLYDQTVTNGGLGSLRST